MANREGRRRSAESVGIPVTLHSGGELALSQAAYLHLAASIPNMAIAIDNELHASRRRHFVREPFVLDAATSPYRRARASA